MSIRSLNFTLILVVMCGIGACATDDAQDKDGRVFAINPLTGEVEEFPDEGSVPSGWQTCGDDPGLCPEPVPCETLDEASCLARSDCEPVYIGIGAYPPGCEDGTSPPELCSGTVFQSCQAISPSPPPYPCPALGCDPYCAPGTVQGVDENGCPTCSCVPEPTPCTKMCDPYCPPGTVEGVDEFGCNTCTCVPESTACDTQSCGPAPGAAPQCPDGSTAETVCAKNGDGICGWQFVCPTPLP